MNVRKKCVSLQMLLAYTQSNTIMDYQFSSRLLEEAVNELSRLPGIGKRTAMRLALHLLKQDESTVNNLGNSLIKLRQDIVFCERCHNVSDQAICHLCAHPGRDASMVCVVEDVRDVIAIENTGQYKGLYHVLGGLINPMDGIAPADLQIDSLIQRCQQEDIQEIIFALAATVEGDTTNFFIFKQIKETVHKVSNIARGVSVGDEIEYADELTLGRSILHRLPYEG